MAVRGINKVILVGRLGKDPEVRYIPNGAQWQTCRVATSESWRDKQTGEIRRSRQNGIAWCCSASSRKWLVSICARGRRSTSKVSFAPVAGRITVSPVTSPKFLLRTTGTMQMLGRAAGTHTQPERRNSSAVKPQPESQPEPKKGGAKTKGRGRKAAQPEPQQPSEPRV